MVTCICSTDIFPIFQLLECGGNLFDAASIAVKAAIFNTS